METTLALLQYCQPLPKKILCFCFGCHKSLFGFPLKIWTGGGKGTAIY